MPWLVRDHPLGRAVWGVVAGTVLIVALVVCQLLGVDAAFTPLVTAVVALGLVSAAAVEQRHRRGPVAERNGLGWLALGTAMLALSFVPLALPWGLVTLPVWLTPVLHLASQAVYPAAVLVAVLRGRMWGLQLAVSRTVLAGLMTVTLTTTYVVVTWLVTRVVPGSGLAQLVGAAAVAVAVQPARLWLERRVHRLVHGTAATPDHVVRRLGSHLSVEGSGDALLGGLAEDVGSAMRLESVSLVTPGHDDVVWGMPSGAPVAVPLRHRGEEVGTMLVTLPGGESLGATGLRTLGDLANVVATAVAVTRAAREVEEARQRLANARLAERRVIRREIHDGLGPSLAGLRLGLRGARNLLDTDPAAAAELLATLQDELDQRVADVRTLSHHLLPPVLDELGLGAALQELAARHAEDGLPCTSTCTTRWSPTPGWPRRRTASSARPWSTWPGTAGRASAPCARRPRTAPSRSWSPTRGAASRPTPARGSGAGRCASAPRSRAGGWRSTPRRARARRSQAVLPLEVASRA